ncbi:proteinase B [Vermiconidia calcicola]|uniref:Proteinase B n=1 Tax=Vermiconidia calcicola TaxID=1690605 RepID=A0ACC3N947_9PEZI|nr:proteinase B [Vermiconidia calcicola]
MSPGKDVFDLALAGAASASPVMLHSIYNDAASIISLTNGQKISNSYVIMFKKHVTQSLLAVEHYDWVNDLDITTQNWTTELEKSSQSPPADEIFNCLRHTHSSLEEGPDRGTILDEDWKEESQKDRTSQPKGIERHYETADPHEGIVVTFRFDTQRRHAVLAHLRRHSRTPSLEVSSARTPSPAVSKTASTSPKSPLTDSRNKIEVISDDEDVEQAYSSAKKSNTTTLSQEQDGVIHYVVVNLIL